MTDVTVKDDMNDLLEKTRQVSRVLQNRIDNRMPDYPRLARLLTDLSAANVYLINREGRILGYSWTSQYDCEIMKELLKIGCMPEKYVEKLNMARESVLNHTDNGLCAYMDEPCTNSNKHVLFVPINGMGERLGTLILARFGEPFATKDLVLAEYLATVVGLEILNDRGRAIEERGRERLVVQMAMRALSFSEVESVKHIIREMGSLDGVVVTSKVADRMGVTRSVIVNALRKLGSAGIIESRSLGMKGTYIKIVSRLFLEEIGLSPENAGKTLGHHLEW
ncbi:MAG: GTP-sensing pleiotropic transcriptional regulator CodY [Synergistaceae bacterium]|jgi:transcriptional pleiotropic repressor|nr:GTP-sensing pleiotropic transcriptional regulator CodY [Synergistaceae bacterium]